MLLISVSIGILLGLITGFIITITSAKGLSPNKIINTILGMIVNITRSIPFILLAIILIPFTRINIGRAFGTLAASVPLTIIASSLFARFTEQSLKEVNPNIIKSAKVMGASKLQIVLFFMLREAAPSIILGFTSAIISIVSYSTAMGILGGGGIGDFAIYHGYTSNNTDLMIIVIIIMVIFVSLIQLLGSFIAGKLDKSRK
jgi:D-methionine transport system permease protein